MTTKECIYCLNGEIETIDEVSINQDCTKLPATNSSKYYEKDTNITCTKKCYYCDGATSTYDNVNMDASMNCPSGFKNKESDLQCDPGKITCWHCEGVSAEPIEVDKSEYETCGEAGYKASKDDLTCSRNCWKCDGKSKVTVQVPYVEGEDCVQAGESVEEVYTNTSAALVCKNLCWRCVGTTPTQNASVAIGEKCTDYDGWADKEEDLDCSEPVKCCECNGDKVVEKGDSNDGNCPTGQTRCDQIVCNNSQTGTSAIVIAWIVGLAAIGYSFYYFRRSNVKI